MIASKEDAIKALMSPFAEALEKIGVGHAYLAKKLKAELNARKTEVFKAKVSRLADPLNPAAGIVETEEVIYSRPMVDWKTRQEGRKDAHKLLGDYPAEKREHTFPGGIPVQIGDIPAAEREAIRAATEAYVRAIESGQKLTG